MAAMTNGVTWFQIGTDDPAGAERFYGTVFGWTFTDDGDARGYRIITTSAEGGIGGGLADNRGDTAPNHAIFYIQVEDVPATIAAAEATGGKVLVPVQRTPDGLVFAHLLDPSGNHVGVYTPPAGER